MNQSFVPTVVDRSRGDYVESKKFNDDNRDLYSDVAHLFEKQLSMYAKSKVMSTAIEAMAAGMAREAASYAGIAVPLTSAFLYPDDKPKCNISTFYGDIVANIESRVSVVVDEVGKIRSGIRVSRSSDNFVFSQTPKSVTETIIEDSVQASELPYLMRVKGIQERLSLRIEIEATFGSMQFNCAEVVPFPLVGGPELRDFDVVDKAGAISLITDSAGAPLDFASKDARRYYFPNRILTTEKEALKVSLDFRSSLFLANQDMTCAGITAIRLYRDIYAPASYIGFRVPSSAGKKLTRVIPVSKWSNTLLDGITIRVYDDRTKFALAGDDFVGSFKTSGIGVPVSTEKELFVLVKMANSKNISPQLVGFDYTVE